MELVVALDARERSNTRQHNIHQSNWEHGKTGVFRGKGK